MIFRQIYREGVWPQQEALSGGWIQCVSHATTIGCCPYWHLSCLICPTFSVHSAQLLSPAGAIEGLLSSSPPLSLGPFATVCCTLSHLSVLPSRSAWSAQSVETIPNTMSSTLPVSGHWPAADLHDLHVSPSASFPSASSHSHWRSACHCVAALALFTYFSPTWSCSSAR